MGSRIRDPKGMLLTPNSERDVLARFSQWHWDLPCRNDWNWRRSLAALLISRLRKNDVAAVYEDLIVGKLSRDAGLRCNQLKHRSTGFFFASEGR